MPEDVYGPSEDDEIREEMFAALEIWARLKWGGPDLTLLCFYHLYKLPFFGLSIAFDMALSM